MFSKDQRYENKKITKSAENRECTINLPGCNYDPSTVVYCHLNGYEWGKGKGLKADDGMGFYGCWHCHSIYDGGIKHNFDRDWLESQAYIAALKTVRIMLKNGVIK